MQVSLVPVLFQEDLDTESDIVEHAVSQKTKKRKRNENTWKVNQKKTLRNSGRAYTGHKQIQHLPRNVKPFNQTCR